MQGAGQGSCSTGLSDTVNLPVRSPYQHHTKLYTAYLEVDNREAEKAPMPVDLVSPIDPSSKLEPTTLGSGLQHQSAALQVEARQPSITGTTTLDSVGTSTSSFVSVLRERHSRQHVVVHQFHLCVKTLLPTSQGPHIPACSTCQCLPSKCKSDRYVVVYHVGVSRIVARCLN